MKGQRLDFAPVGKAKRGKGPKGRKQLRQRLLLEQSRKPSLVKVPDREYFR
jgi:hypothetical protein